MDLPRTVARWLMRWTAHRPPERRAIWALAMQREFDTLEEGELGWALGCAATMAGWKLRAQWLYLALLFAAPALVYAVGALPFELLRMELVSPSAFRSFFRSYGTLVALLTPLPLAVILGAYRPNSIATTLVLGCLLAQHVGGTIYIMFTLGGSFLSWWGPNATLYMAPPLVGLCGSLWVWYAGAKLGAHWAKRRAPR